MTGQFVPWARGRSLTNVVLPPHRARGTRQAYWRIGRARVADLERYAAGQPPVHDFIVDSATVRRQGRDLSE